MAQVEIDGVRLETRTIPGDAGLPWLVLLHEGLGSVSLWRDFPEKLARRTGSRVLAYSRRGYGQSEALAPVPPGRPRRTPAFFHEEATGALPRLLARHGIERPVLVGHSDGASIALVAAARVPDLARAAVLMAPHVHVEEASLASIARIRQGYAAGELRARLARHHANVDDAFLGWADTWLDPAFRGMSLAPEIAALRCPTLVVQGSADEYGTTAHVDAIAAGAPGPVTRLVLDGCGHHPHREREAEVLDAIAAFLARLPRGA